MRALVTFAITVMTLLASFPLATNTFAAGEMPPATLRQVLLSGDQSSDVDAIKQLDAIYEKTGWQSGAQSEGTLTVPANSVFWGNSEGINLPPEQFLQLRGRIWYSFVDVQTNGGRYIPTTIAYSACRDVPEIHGFCGAPAPAAPVAPAPAPQPAPAVAAPSGATLAVSDFAVMYCSTDRSNPGPLIGQLDNAWNSSGGTIGGSSSTNLGKVPAGAILWTNHEGAAVVASTGAPVTPDKLAPLRVTGPFVGVFATYDEIVNPRGGRYAVLDRPLNPSVDLPCWGR